jgi:2,5-diketo-D-gluconate reductase B
VRGMSVYSRGVFQRGFGTFPLQGEVLADAVRNALEIGYRAFDTAQWYGNEAGLGSVLSASAVPRDELLVTTKVHPRKHGCGAFPAICGTESPRP